MGGYSCTRTRPSLSINIWKLAGPCFLGFIFKLKEVTLEVVLYGIALCCVVLQNIACCIDAYYIEIGCKMRVWLMRWIGGVEETFTVKTSLGDVTPKHPLMLQYQFSQNHFTVLTAHSTVQSQIQVARWNLDV